MKKLTKVERFLLTNQGENYKSYRCPTHGVFQIPVSKDVEGCAHPGCLINKEIEVIGNPIEYEKCH